MPPVSPSAPSPGGDTFAAGRPLLGVPGLGRASVTALCGNPPRGCAWTGPALFLASSQGLGAWRLMPLPDNVTLHRR
ncbi:hypothetical protein DBR12_19570 [Acidovorax sp. HMWF029]|nr:hypothetical protein DBR12_19570 [Acidovorax sp. HMWF029]